MTEVLYGKRECVSGYGRYGFNQSGKSIMEVLWQGQSWKYNGAPWWRLESVFMDVDRMPLLARNVPLAQNMKSSKLCPQAQHLALHYHYACYYGFNVTPYTQNVSHFSS